MRIDYFRSLSIPMDPGGTMRSIEIYYNLLKSTAIFELVPPSPQSRALDFHRNFTHMGDHERPRTVTNDPGRSDGPHARTRPGSLPLARFFTGLEA